MSILHPADQRAKRAIIITTIAVLALANVGVIILFSFAAGASDGGKAMESIFFYLLGSLILGVGLSFFKPSLGGLILLVPIIIFCYIAANALYNYWQTGIGYFY